MKVRLGILIACVLITGAFLQHRAAAEPTPIRQPLSTLPFVIGDWRGRPAGSFSKEVLAVLRVDDYLTRSYVSPSGDAVSLYIGYHATQRQGASIHSPLNCLPGAGWLPVEQGPLAVVVPDARGGAPERLVVNRVIIEKGLDRQLVLYWYQSHGRVVASEYWGKVYSVVDAIRLNRTDAAMVRIMVPMTGNAANESSNADASAVNFLTQVFPLLREYIPS